MDGNTPRQPLSPRSKHFSDVFSNTNANILASTKLKSSLSLGIAFKKSSTSVAFIPKYDDSRSLGILSINKFMVSIRSSERQQRFQFVNSLLKFRDKPIDHFARWVPFTDKIDGFGGDSLQNNIRFFVMIFHG